MRYHAWKSLGCRDWFGLRKANCLGVEKGNLIKTIDWLHVDEVSALASGNGMLFSIVSPAVLRLRPPSRFGVVAAATQAQLASSRSRFQALWLVTVEFWVAAVLAIVEAIQLCALQQRVRSALSRPQQFYVHSWVPDAGREHRMLGQLHTDNSCGRFVLCVWWWRDQRQSLGPATLCVGSA